MAINAYIGLMGSGKSFEVVSSVIVPALLTGRRVVTNIDGINPAAIEEYLLSVKKGKTDQLGQVIGCCNDDLNKTGFFPDETKPEQSSIVKPGDLVCIDECWNFWGDDHKISEEHMRFFRMHRHYTDAETGTSCDLALMIQDLGTLNRKIRAVIEMTTRTIKLKSLGMPKAYRVELYEGNKTTKLTKIDTFVKMYDKAIFPLYKSYAAGAGSEKVIDKRQNIFTNSGLWVSAALVVAMLVAGSYFTYKFFRPTPKPEASSASQAVAQGSPEKSSQKAVSPEYSQDWRYAGNVSLNGDEWAVIVDNSGRIRYESPSVFKGSGRSVVGVIEGKKITSYSGGSNGNNYNLAPQQSEKQRTTK